MAPDDLKHRDLENPRATIGGNMPPPQDAFAEINENLPSYLEGTFDNIVQRAQDLLAALDRVPEIGDEETAGRVSDFVAQVNACVKEAEGRRVDLVSGPLTTQRTINTFFNKNVFDILDTPKGASGVKQKLLKMLTGWEQKKAEMERRRRQEEEARARAAAAEAERLRLEAERKAREAAEAERRRQEEEARRKREAEEAERRRKAEEERKIREAEEARIAKIENERQMKTELARQEKLRKEREEREAREAVERAEREKAEAERQAREAAEAERRRIEAEAAAQAAREAAERAEAERAAAEKAASAKAAELHTVRGDYGSSSSLRGTWKGYITDREALLKDPTIHPFIAEDALQKAVNAHVKIHKNTKPIAGVDIRYDTGAVVRG